jgi:hypothetical protein
LAKAISREVEVSSPKGEKPQSVTMTEPAGIDESGRLEVDLGPLLAFRYAD